ncbi:uncharacterized protein LOC134539471 isoform X2 [Bacillus rossius redtenbacheri]
MAGRQPTLARGQFSAPIRPFSRHHAADSLAKQARVLGNGAVGIDFHQLAAPTNLANSAVLRMLEEEERSGDKGFKRVEWPPPLEENDLPLIESEPVYAKGPASGSVPSVQPVARQPPPQVYHPPPPATVTLRASPPVREDPHPVFESQPAATRATGPRMRGDQKWPPVEYKARAEEENAARQALAKGPAFRPRKVNKDYTTFFAKNALTATYPGYRAPPGTQHYAEEGTSDL